jgi:hypothetical protein
MRRVAGALLSLAALTAIADTTTGCRKRHRSQPQRAATSVRARAVINDANGDGLADIAVADAPLGAMLLFGTHRASSLALSSAPWRWTVSASDPSPVRAGAMAFIGDLNGDRRSELAIGEAAVSPQEACPRGGVRIYLGDARGFGREPAYRIEAPAPMGEGTDHYAFVGAHIARVDAIDGPRTTGFVVSARRTRVSLIEPVRDAGDAADADAQSEAGAQRSEFCQGDELWVLRSDGRTPSQRLFIEQGEVQRIVIGHVDRDAFRDMVVLAPPKAIVFRGRAGGFEERAAIVLDDPHDAPQRWSDVAIGDVDGDGDGEIVLTFQYGVAPEGVTRAGVVHFDVLGDSRQVALSAPTSERNEAAVGRSVLVVRDQDGDGRDEIVVADPNLRAVLVYRGNAESNWPAPDRVLRVSESAGALGVTLVDGGDIDGDGRDDIIVRAARDDGGMATLYVASPLRGELARVELAPGPEGFGYSLAGRSSSQGGGHPRELPPRARRCEVASATEHPEALVTVGAPMVRADRARIEAALRERTVALAQCHERWLREDCNHQATASLTLLRSDAGVVSVAGVAWGEQSNDALRDCVQQALTAPLIDRSSPGADGPVVIEFRAQR